MSNTLTGPNADSIYTAVLYLGQPGTYHFKFFKGSCCDGGEWTGDPNRALTVAGNVVANYTWGINGQVGIKVNPLANKVSTYPVPFRNTLTINTLVDVKKVVITTAYGQQVARYDNFKSGNTTVNTSQLSSGMYFVTFYGNNGERLTKKLIKD